MLVNKLEIIYIVDISGTIIVLFYINWQAFRCNATIESLDINSLTGCMYNNE